jgi:hypothetical protein
VNTSGLPIAVVEAGVAAMRADPFLAGALDQWTGPADELLERLAVPLAAATATWSELRRRSDECATRGHDLEIVEDSASSVPVALTCRHCGETWATALVTLPDIAVPETPNGHKPPARRKVAVASNGTKTTEPEPQPAVEPQPEPEPAVEPEPEPEPEPDGAGPLESLPPVEIETTAECEVCGDPVDPRTAIIDEIVGDTPDVAKLLCTRHLWACEANLDGCETLIGSPKQLRFSLTRFRQRMCESCLKATAAKP